MHAKSLLVLRRDVSVVGADSVSLVESRMFVAQAMYAAIASDFGHDGGGAHAEYGEVGLGLTRKGDVVPPL